MNSRIGVIFYNGLSMLITSLLRTVELLIVMHTVFIILNVGPVVAHPIPVDIRLHLVFSYVRDGWVFF